MAAKKRAKPNFGQNVARNAEKKQQQGKSRGWFMIPKDMSLFKEHETDRERIKLDILPYLVTDDKHPDADPEDPESALKGNYWYKRPAYLHYQVGSGNTAVVCPKLTKGKRCPICEYTRQKWEEYNAGKIEKDGIPSKPQLRYIYVVIPLNVKDYDEKPYLWDIANGNFQEVIEEDLKEKPEKGDFPSLEGGRTLEIRFSADKIGKNEYFYASDIDYPKREEDYDEAILDEVPNLDDLLVIKSYKEIEALFYELDEDEATEEDAIDEGGEEESEEEQPAKSYRKPRRHKESKESEESEEEEEDKEEEDEPPKRSARRKTETPPKRKPKSAGKRGTKKKSEEEEEESEDDGCPHGYRYGYDWDEYDKCLDCEVYDACGERNEKLEKEGKL